MKMRDEEDDATEEFPEATTLHETGSYVSAWNVCDSLSLLSFSLSAVSLSHTHAHSCGVASSNSCASCVVRRVLCVRSDNVVVGADILNIPLTIFACRT